MIIIAWYNVVAIVVGILFFLWFCKIGNGSSIGHGVAGTFVLLLALLFFAVWGGIFWW